MNSPLCSTGRGLVRATLTGATGAGRTGGAGPTHRVPVVVHSEDPISRAGTVSQLRPHPEIDLRDATETAAPGTVAMLIDETPDDSTLARLRRLVRGEGAQVVLVVRNLREAELLEVVECGVGAVVWRHEATEQRLLQAVLAASRGEGDLPADLLGRLLRRVGTMQRSAAQQSSAPVTGLVPREIDVLRLVADGLDTAEIAAKLAYSERTVKNVMHGMTTRLHLRNRAHAVAYALREGYI